MGKTNEEIWDGPLPGRDQRMSPLRWITYIIVKIVLKVLFRYRVEGFENFARYSGGQAAVIAANHASYIDPAVLLIILKMNARFIAKEELFHNRVLAWFFTRIGAIPVKRHTADRQVIRRSVAALKRGEPVGIFPEGTRVRSPEQEVENQAGCVLIASMAKVPIIPVGIDGTDRIRPKGSRFFRLPTVRVRIGEPIDLKSYEGLPKAGRTQVIIDDVMRRCYELKGSPPYGLRGAERFCHLEEGNHE